MPLFWGPIVIYLFLRSILQFTAPLPDFFEQPLLHFHALTLVPSESVAKAVVCFFVGNIIWTILEYTLHRFLFHVDDWLPDRPSFLTLHFLMHGIHHYMPMDRCVVCVLRGYWVLNPWVSLRLVMPPVLFFTLQAPFTTLAHAIFPTAVANGIISGSFAFCKRLITADIYHVLINQHADILYDCMHYALVTISMNLRCSDHYFTFSLHHTRLPSYLREMKKYHLAHHYKNFELGFGVTSKYLNLIVVVS